MTKPKRYKRYSVEFKREAIRRGSEEGTTDAAVCAELGISTRQFRRWRDELHFRAPKSEIPGFRPAATCSRLARSAGVCDGMGKDAEAEICPEAGQNYQIVQMILSREHCRR